MAGSLGDLLISIAGDIAQLQVSMGRAEYLTDQTAQKVERAMGRIDSAIKGVAAGFVSFEALKAFEEKIEGAVEAASALEEFSIKTGVAAQTLSGFKELAHETNTDMGSLGTGLSRLAKNMLDAAGGTGKAVSTFQELGLNVKGADGQLKNVGDFAVELAKKLGDMANETQRSGYEIASLGRSGTDLNNFMLKLAETGKQQGMVTNQQAKEAHEFTLVMRDLSLITQKFFNTIAEQVTPVLTALAKTWRDLRTESGSLADTTQKMAAQNEIRRWAIDASIAALMVVDALRYVFAGLKAIGDTIVFVGSVVIEAFKNIGTTVVDASMGIEGFVKILQGVVLMLAGQWKAGWDLAKEGFADITNAGGQLRDRFVESYGEIKDAGSKWVKNMEGIADTFGSAVTGKFLDNLANLDNAHRKAAKGTDTHTVAAKTLKDGIDSLIEGLEKQNAKLQENVSSFEQFGVGTKATKEAEVAAQLEFMKTNGELDKHVKAYNALHAEAPLTLADLMAQILALAKHHDGLTLLTEDWNKYAAAVAGARGAMGQNVQAIVDSVEQQRRQNEAIGLTASETSEVTARFYDAKAALARLTEGGEDAAKMYELMAQKTRDLANLQREGQGIKEMIDGWKQVGDIVGNFASEILTHGVGSAIQYLRNQFKQLLAEMIAIFAKRWILNMVGNAVGGGVGAGLTSAAGQAGANSLAGNLLSSGSGAASTYLFGSAGGSAGGYMAGLEVGGEGAIYSGATEGLVGAGGFAATIGTAATGVAEGMGVAAASAAAFGEAVAAAIPVVGWIVAIGMILYSVFGGKGGGPKQQGAFAGTFDSTGALVNPLANGPNLVDILGDNQQRQGAMDIATSTGTGIAQFIRAMGAQGQQFNIGVGFATDPAGSAPGFIHTLLQNAQGQTVFKQNIDDASRDPTEFQGQMSDAMKRVWVAALQQVDFGSDFVNNIFRGIKDITKLTGADVDALLQQAIMAHQVIAGLTTAGLKGLDIDTLAKYQITGETIAQTFQRVVGPFLQLQDAFTSQATKMNLAEGAVNSLNSALGDAGYAIPQTREQFLDVIKSIDQTTEAGRALYVQMINAAGAFDAVTSAAEANIQAFDQYMGAHRAGYTQGMQESSLASDIASLAGSVTQFAGESSQQILEQLHNMTREDFSKFDDATQKLILAILGLDSSLNDTTKAIVQMAPTRTESDIYSGLMSGFQSRYGGLIDAQPDAQSKITTRATLLQGQITSWQHEVDAMRASGSSLQDMEKMTALLHAISDAQGQLDGLGSTLASLTVYTAQYGASAASQLVDLDSWYKTQQALLAGNQDALTILDATYQQKRKDIISKGNADALTELQKAQNQLADYVRSLATNTQLTTLTPMEQLASARDKYQALLAKAQGGDVTAIGQLQGASTDYLQLARSIFASSGFYTSIFDSVTSQLSGVAGIANPITQQTTNTALVAALPPNGTLASQADVRELKASVEELTTVMAGGVSVTDPTVAAVLSSLLDAVRQGSLRGSLVRQP